MLLLFETPAGYSLFKVSVRRDDGMIGLDDGKNLKINENLIDAFVRASTLVVYTCIRIS